VGARTAGGTLVELLIVLVLLVGLPLAEVYSDRVSRSVR
jgi:hypothetical protein